jgi:NADPH:quinone reductase-like Zn-dependent oxidoreductase
MAVAVAVAVLLLALVMCQGKDPARAMAVVRVRAMAMTAEAVDVVGVVVDVAGEDVDRVGLGDRVVPMAGQRMLVFLVNRGSPVVIRRRTGATKEATAASVGRVLSRWDIVMRAGLRNGTNVLRPGIGSPAGRRIGVRMNRRHRLAKPELTVPEV